MVWEDDGKQSYEEVKYIEPSHRKLYGEVIRLKQARIRRRLIPPYQTYRFSTGKKNAIQSLHQCWREGKLISNSFPFVFSDVPLVLILNSLLSLGKKAVLSDRYNYRVKIIDIVVVMRTFACQLAAIKVSLVINGILRNRGWIPIKKKDYVNVLR